MESFVKKPVTAAPCNGRVLIYKSCGELFLLVQPIIQCVYLAYFDPKKYILKQKCSFLALMLSNFLVRTLQCTETQPQHRILQQIFKKNQYCRPAQNQPKSRILFHKNRSPRDLYTVILFNGAIDWKNINCTAIESFQLPRTCFDVNEMGGNTAKLVEIISEGAFMAIFMSLAHISPSHMEKFLFYFFYSMYVNM